MRAVQRYERKRRSRTAARGIALTLALALLLTLTPLMGCTPRTDPVTSDPTGTGDPTDPNNPDNFDPALIPTLREDAIDPTGERAGTPYCDRSLYLPPDPDVQSAAELLYLLLDPADNPTLPFGVDCYIDADASPVAVTAVVPAGTDLSAAVLTFALYGDRLEAASGALVSGETALDLRQPVPLTLYAADGDACPLLLTVQALDTGLPAVCVTTPDFTSVSSRDYYVEDTAVQVGGGDGALFPFVTAQPVQARGGVKGRGNSTWGHPKKSFTLKLEQKTALLGMPANKDWVLQANYEDKSLMRNMAGHWLSEQAGLAYTPRIRYVDLWLNGVYWGGYMLMEKVEISKNRVNITPFDETLPPDQVGYLMEFDGHVNEVPASQKNGWENIGPLIYDPRSGDVFTPISIGNKWLTIKKPGAARLTEAHAQYIYDRVDEVVSALYGDDYAAVERLLDVRSFARWYLVEEFMDNADSSMHSSVYMTLDAGGKFTLGPVWDFDRSSGNCDYWNKGGAADSLYKSGAGWFHRLFRFKEARAILLEEWASFQETAARLPAQLDLWAAQLTVSQHYNFARWDILSKRVGSNPSAVVNADSYEGQVTLLRNWCERRLEKMKKVLQ